MAPIVRGAHGNVSRLTRLPYLFWSFRTTTD